MKTSCFVSLALFGSALFSSLGAQPKDASTDRTARDDMAVYALADQAKALVKLRRLTELEATVAQLAFAKPATTEWHLEIAQRLLQAAEQAARDGATEGVAEVAQLALGSLARADKPEQPAGVRAAVRMQAGFIRERFLGDADGALAEYEAAARLAPEHAAAGEAASRLKDAKEARMGQPSRKGGAS